MRIRKPHLLLTIFFFCLFTISGYSQNESVADSNNTADQELTLSQQINNSFTPFVATMGKFLFWDPFAWSGIYDDKVYDEQGEIVINEEGEPVTAPLKLIVVWLIVGALFFTVFMRFINFRGIGHAIGLIRGKYDHPDDKGEVSHFQALTAALSGTVGLGNIAGVAIAISLGGPGATFWMILAGLLGMSSKFVECTLGVKYRDVGEDGTIYGGPMYYLKKGLADVGKSGLGKVLAVLFAIMCIGGSFGGGNMFQANQAAQQFNTMIGANSTSAGLVFGLIMSVVVGVVIIGGIKRIGSITEKVVPFMVGIYFLAAVVILVYKFDSIGWAFGQIIDGAFNAKGISGGLLGVLIIGFQRAAFSNEAGVGSAAIAHSAVKTKYPASEGLVALLEPFIDTVVVCTMTALVIIITNGDGSIMTYGVKSPDGVLATSKAFASVIPWFPYVLTVAVVLFAFSTMLSWSYYGLQSWMFLFGRSKASDYTYKILFCLFIIIGSAVSLGAVTDFSDAMIFAMAVPNIIGLFFLFPKVREELSRYLAAIKAKKA